MPELLPPSFDNVRQAVRAAGFLWFDTPTRPWNVNLVALRTPSRVAGVFDDAITLACHDEAGRPVFRCWQATTDPGLTWLLDTSARADGIAVLVPGQYRRSHTIRPHANSYDAICHTGEHPLPVYRDANHDGIVDLGGRVHVNGYGINVHASRYPRPNFDDMMLLARKAAAAWGNRFTLTLLDWPAPIWPDEVVRSSKPIGRYSAGCLVHAG